MERFGFLVEFLNRVKFLFLDANACVSVNGSLTKIIHFPRSAPRVPLSTLFDSNYRGSLKVEERAGHIRGITLLGTLVPQTILQYANDSSLMLGGGGTDSC